MKKKKETVRLSVVLSKSIKDKLEVEAKKEGRTMSNFAAHIIQKYLDDKK